MTKKEEREVIKAMFDGRCAYCGGLLGSRWHIDHVDPIWRYKKTINGKLTTIIDRPENDIRENKMPSCMSCNLWKHTLSLEQFRDDLLQQVRRARDYSRNFRMAEKFGLIKETNEKVVFYFERFSTHQPKEE